MYAARSALARSARLCSDIGAPSLCPALGSVALRQGFSCVRAQFVILSRILFIIYLYSILHSQVFYSP
jgi:hypothetical protein